jgi:addiction module RelE/StbE family toxin
MRILLRDESFNRAIKRRCKNRPQLQTKVLEILCTLERDPFSSSLKTHKLQGDLKGLWACSVEYDFRIIFKFVSLDGEPEDAIVLIDVGTHDEVY